MNNLIRNIKEHKIAALVCAVLLIAVIAVMVILIWSEKGQTDKPDPDSEQIKPTVVTDYFADSDYPVKVTSGGKGFSISIDGSKSPDCTWEVASDDTEQRVVVLENSDGNELQMESALIPVFPGYATLTYSRGGEISGIAYNAVSIEADVYVSSDDDGKMMITLSDIRQTTSSAGALDTDTPYLINGSRVLLPNGGDWLLVPAVVDGAPDSLYSIARYSGENGLEYFYVQKDPSVIETNDYSELMKKLDESKLVLVSESLGIQQTLDCKLSSDKVWVLTVSDEQAEVPELTTSAPSHEEVKPTSEPDEQPDETESSDDENYQEDGNESEENPSDE